MQQHLADYLFQYRKLVLPGLGSLQILRTEAEYDAATQQIFPPKPYIRFTEQKIEADEDVFDYLRANAFENGEAAENFFIAFRERLHDLAEGAQVSFGAAGYFTRTEGKLVFIDNKLPDEMLPPVSAARVLRVDRVHSITVGDKETTNTVMTEYFTEEEKVPRARWWIAALILFLIAVGGFVMYTQSERRNQNFGRETGTEIKEPTTHHTTIPADQ